MKTRKVFWTIDASVDLMEVVDYISRDKPSTAMALYGEIKSKCRLLNKSPQKCRIVPELAELGITAYREIIHGPYRIIYKLAASDVYVIAVIDGRRDFETFIYDRLLRTGLA